MSSVSRRRFLQSSAMFISTGVLASAFRFAPTSPELSFSTLGCPDWPLAQIISFAKQNGYKGIEVRGIQKEMDLTKCPDFSPQNIKATLRGMKDNNLRFVNLGSSCTLHFPAGEERNKNLEEGKRFIDLAQQLSCPYIRVFPNQFLKERSKEETIDLIAKGLLELGDYAQSRNVRVLMETHGDMVHISDLQTLMQKAKHPHTGLVWDVTNMWTITGEPPRDVYAALKPYIYHAHIKDAVKKNGNVQYKLLGEGEVPVFEAIDSLRKGGYNGFYSFEWEKLWHPDIAAPDIAIADYPKKMKSHFN